MSESNTSERTTVQLGLATLAAELGASEGDVISIASDGTITLTTPGGGGGGSLPTQWTVGPYGTLSILPDEGQTEIGLNIDDETHSGIVSLGRHGSYVSVVNPSATPLYVGGAGEWSLGPQTADLFVVETKFVVGPTGSVLVKPSTADAPALEIEGIAEGSGQSILAAHSTEGNTWLSLGSDGDLVLTTFPDGDALFAAGPNAGSQNAKFAIGPTGAITITPGDDVNALTIAAGNAPGADTVGIFGADGQTGKMVTIQDFDGAQLFTVGPTGAVAIRASGTGLTALSAFDGDGQGFSIVTSGDASASPLATLYSAATAVGRPFFRVENDGDGGDIFTVENGDGPIFGVGDSAALVQIGPTGAVAITPSVTGGNALTIHPLDEDQWAISAGYDDDTYGMFLRRKGLTLSTYDVDGANAALTVFTGEAGDQVFTIGPTGTVAIAPRGDYAKALKVTASAGMVNQVFWVEDATHSPLLSVDPDGSMVNAAGGDVRIQTDATGLAFFGATPVARQATPADIGDVIALLQAYGLAA